LSILYDTQGSCDIDQRIQGVAMIEIKAWYWLVFGMVLIMVELIVPSFTILWFGLGAFVVALLLWVVPDMAMSWQLFFWSIASVVFTAFWFLFFKPRMVDKTSAGISLEAVLGESGLVIKRPEARNRGIVKFTTPLLGAEQWQFICKDNVEPGDRVAVIDVSGNTLVVKKK